MFTAEDIKRFESFTQAFRRERPNSPIVKGVKVKGGEPVHLTIDDLESLVKLARRQLPVREIVRLGETVLASRQTGEVRTRVESRIEAGL